MSEMSRVAWNDGEWLNAPVSVVDDGDELLVTAAEGSDFWRTTSYGFIHDNGHALLRPLADGKAVEVSWVLEYVEQFDQAGVLVRADESTWIKAGVEFCDGDAQLGAVVTCEVSDWSVAPVGDWFNELVTVRASLSGDAVTIRARVGSGAWRLVRVAPWPPGVAALAGPMVCAPTRAGLTVRLVSWHEGPADTDLH
jgi:uncharacterized protein